VSSEGISVPDPLVFANAPPANAKDIPATPNSGAARLPRFFLGACFVCDIPASNTLDPKKFRRMDRKDFAVQKRSDSLDYALSLLRSETNFCVSNLKSSCLPALASNQPASHPMFKTRRPCGPVPRFCNMPRRCSMVPHHRALRGGMGTLMVFLRSIIVESSRSEWTGWGPPLFCRDLSDG
jgi:hypothetical protein